MNKNIVIKKVIVGTKNSFEKATTTSWEIQGMRLRRSVQETEHMQTFLHCTQGPKRDHKVVSEK